LLLLIIQIDIVRTCPNRNSSAILDRMDRINKIKATLFHPDYPVRN